MLWLQSYGDNPDYGKKENIQFLFVMRSVDVVVSGAWLQNAEEKIS